MSGLDRDAARVLLLGLLPLHPNLSEVEDALDALEGCVRPCPPPTVDRDALTKVLLDWMYRRHDWAASQVVEMVLALLRPAGGGVTLTPDEAAAVVRRIRQDYAEGDNVLLRALAARLEEAAS